MVELVKIHNTVRIGSEVVNTVNARDLHKALESGKDFSAWIKARIEKLNLAEGVDYIIIESVGSVSTHPNRGFEDLEQNGTKSYNINNLVKKVKDYYVTIEIAKHIAMMESTDKGREVRKYFIECEKQLTLNNFKPMTLKESLLLNLELVEKNEVLTLENKELKSELKYTNNKLDGFLEANKDRRSKKEMSASIVSNVRLLAKQKFNENYRAAYNHIYDKFKAMHNITAKVNMDYLRKNNDYLAEVLEITISELD